MSLLLFTCGPEHPIHYIGCALNENQHVCVCVSVIYYSQLVDERIKLK